MEKRVKNISYKTSDIPNKPGWWWFLDRGATEVVPVRVTRTDQGGLVFYHMIHDRRIPGTGAWFGECGIKNTGGRRFNVRWQRPDEEAILECTGLTLPELLARTIRVIKNCGCITIHKITIKRI